MADENFEILIEIRNKLDGLVATERALKKTSQTAKSLGQTLQVFYGNLSANVATAAIRGLAQQTQQYVSRGVSHLAYLQNQEIAYKKLLGSQEAADKRLAQLRQFTNATPNRLKEVIQSDFILQKFSDGVLNSEENLRLLGDAAAALPSAGIQDLSFWVARLYDMLDNGKPAGEALMRLQELGAITGEMRTKLESVKDGAEAWAILEENWSQFAGTMGEQSQTITGLMSTLEDVIDDVSAAFVEGAVGGANFSEGIKTLKDFLADPQTQANARALGDAFGSIVRTAGAIAGGVDSGFGHRFAQLEALRRIVSGEESRSSPLPRNPLFRGVAEGRAAIAHQSGIDLQAMSLEGFQAQGIDQADMFALQGKDREAFLRGWQRAYQSWVAEAAAAAAEVEEALKEATSPLKEPHQLPAALDPRVLLAQNRAEQTQIEGDPFRLASTKQPEQIELLKAELSLRERLAEHTLAQSYVTQSKGELEDAVSLMEDYADQLTRIEEIQNLLKLDNFWAEQEAGIIAWADGFGDQAERVSEMVTGTLDAAVQGLSNSLYALATQTGGLEQVWLSFGQTALRALTDLIAQEALLFLQRQIFSDAEEGRTAGKMAMDAVAAAWKALKDLGPILGPIAFAAGAAGTVALARSLVGREHGGEMLPGGAYLVGEKRPEVVVPGEYSRVIPSVDQYMERYMRPQGDASPAGGGVLDGRPRLQRHSAVLIEPGLPGRFYRDQGDVESTFYRFARREGLGL